MKIRFREEWTWPARLNGIAAVLGAAWAAGLLIFNAEMATAVAEFQIDVVLFVLMIILFAAAPYAGLLALGFVIRRRPVMATLLLLATLATAGYGSYEYGKAAFSGMEGVSFYVFFLVPAFQIVVLCGLAAVLLPAHIVGRLIERRRETPDSLPALNTTPTQPS